MDRPDNFRFDRTDINMEPVWYRKRDYVETASTYSLQTDVDSMLQQHRRLFLLNLCDHPPSSTWDPQNVTVIWNRFMENGKKWIHI